MKHQRIHCASLCAGALLVAAPTFLMSMQRTEARDFLVLTPEQKEILGHLSIVYLDDGSGSNLLKTIRVSGTNLQVVNGLGATNGNPSQPLNTSSSTTQVNGLGNVIVGYNEPLNFGFAGNFRTGSHSIVTGIGSNYDSFGGVIAGAYNNVTGAYSSALGGENNTVSGEYSAIVGGGNFDPADGNVAAGSHSAIVGGAGNFAGGGESVIVGGFSNSIPSTGFDATVVGGHVNSATMDMATVLGGVSNTATGHGAVVAGGQNNEADGLASTVSGGLNRTVSTLNTSGNTSTDWVGGSLSEDF